MRIMKPQGYKYKFCCINCGSWFLSKRKDAVYCSAKCTASVSQRKRASESWEVYFKRLLNSKKTERKNLSVQDCLKLLKEQNYLCALSGIELTHIIQKDFKCETNASLDRIEAGGPYIKENIQLVCSVLNQWRGDTDSKEFIWWCQKVSEYSLNVI